MGKQYLMHLHPAPFAAVKARSKSAELRLNDGKRSLIEEGDRIVFKNRVDGEMIEVEVSEVKEARSFKELLEYFGPAAATSIEELRSYYSSEEEKTLGVRGFGFTIAP